jgi:hypothetical protein
MLTLEREVQFWEEIKKCPFLELLEVFHQGEGEGFEPENCEEIVLYRPPLQMGSDGTTLYVP